MTLSSEEGPEVVRSRRPHLGAGGGPPARARDPRRTALLVVVAVALGLVVTATGSYGLGWKWTGFRGNKVWDWMHLLLVPIVLGAQPLWIRTRDMHVHWRELVIALLVGLGAFIALSYGLRWTWTGFEGKQLWDWLNLIVLPTVLGLCGLWLGGERAPRYWRPLAAAGAVVFVAVVIGGYRLHWKWTGFQGNTLWDWLNLLVLPFAVPAAFIWIGLRLEDERDHEREPGATGAAGAPARAAAPGIES